MLWQRKSFLALALAALVSGCGFTPVYQRGGVQDTLRHIEVVRSAQSREQQLLVSALEDLLAPQGALGTQYRLQPNLSIVSQPLSLDADGTTRRMRLLGTSNMVLTDVSTGAVVLNQQVQQFTSYNISDDADYSTYVSAQDASFQLTEALAEEIRLRLIQHFADATP